MDPIKNGDIPASYVNGTWTRIEDVFPFKNGDIPLLC